MNLTPEEKRVFGQLFRQADTDGLGVVTGEVAVKFFEKTRLEPRILGEVCALHFNLKAAQNHYKKHVADGLYSRYGK